jgi:hypothetical protein
MVAVLANRTGNPALDPVCLTAAAYINRGLVQTGLVEMVDDQWVLGVLADRNRAVELLRDATAQGAVDPRDHLHSEPRFAALHGDPPFDELLRPKG